MLKSSAGSLTPLDIGSIWEFPFSDSLVLVRPDLSNFYILNSTGASAWRLLRSGHSLELASHEFASQYGIPVDVASHDLKLAWDEWERTVLAPISSLPSPTRAPTLPSDNSQAFSRTYQLHGRVIRVILHDAELVAEIGPRLEPLLAVTTSSPDITIQATASENGYQVFSGPDHVATEENAALARVIFLQEFVRVSQINRKWASILHAAALGMEDKCVILPAASHSGKTTLAAVLMNSGLTFYSDDSVALKADTLLVPAMPFAMMIREGSWPLISARFPKFGISPKVERYGESVRFLQPSGAIASGCAKAVAVVFPSWHPTTKTEIQTLTSFEALVRLKDCGFWVSHTRENISDFLMWLESLPAYDITYSDVDEATKWIRQILLSPGAK